MRIVQVGLGDLRKDVRVQKTGRYLKRLGHEVIYVSLWHYNESNCVFFPINSDESGSLYYVANNRAGSVLGDAIEDEFAPDVIHAHELDALWPVVADFTPEAVTGLMRGAAPIDLQMKTKSRHARVVYDAHEWESGRRVDGKCLEETELLMQERAWRESICLQRCQAVIAVSPAIVEKFHATYGIVPYCVPNCPVLPDIRFDRRQMRALLGIRDDDRVVAFAGNITGGRKLDLLAEAMEWLTSDWRLMIIGQMCCFETVKALAATDRAMFIAPKPYPYGDQPYRKTLLDYLRACDVGINLTDMTIPSYRMALPNKLFEYAFADLVTVSSRQEDSEKLTRRYGLGCVVEDELDARDLATAIVYADTQRVRQSELRAEFRSAWSFEAQCQPALDKIYS